MSDLSPNADYEAGDDSFTDAEVAAMDADLLDVNRKYAIGEAVLSTEAAGFTSAESYRLWLLAIGDAEANPAWNDGLPPNDGYEAPANG